MTGGRVMHLTAKRVLVLAFAAFALPAAAQNFAEDRVHADSFGNLVVYSSAGYKRIIVGQGHLARELSNYTRGDSEIAYSGYDGVRQADCYRPPVLVKGRSYMYGLDQGEIPVLSPCR